MSRSLHSIDLTPEELDLVQSALHTQEKILSVQSKAGGDDAIRSRLTALRGVLQSLGKRQPPPSQRSSWLGAARTLFG